ncbi:hypothetical protein Sgly_1676 [Syntrophobotulus glycolicus DSM 8271]|uniref:DUF2953 domain-containing protein n=1 Tax=Syntrophobotulus glycolicus (strain DSM 8271 / FlGlyR) TaxID=645991 RepID=F0SYD9_SYNGF|nr:DUF2953 domain-containing protein [Syntrophobotulus glycolicus]ADY55974.1 hypothetical protein Sgly_1676 [Syntrophobotulus glycolicus DSM 8271]
MRIRLMVKTTGLHNRFRFQWEAGIVNSAINLDIPLEQLKEGYLDLISNIIHDTGETNSFSVSRKTSRFARKIKTGRYRAIKTAVKNLCRYSFILGWLSDQIKRIQKNFYRQLKLERLNLNLILGTGDAQLTAYAYGLAWQLIGQAAAKMYRTVRVATGKKIQIQVNPDFTKAAWDCTFDCILKMKISHIIVIAYHALLLMIRSRRTIKTWMNTR